MKRTIVLLAVLVMLLGVTAVTAVADEHLPIPPHGHMLVLGIEFDEDFEPVSYEKCVDLANNRFLRLNAQHEHMHFGPAGVALFNAGHVVVPTTPFGPADDCADLAELFGPPSR